ncbi:hypothetical protein [Microbacterium sp.]|nr:hypothetical protein [Microbacterium sp.]
MIIVFVLLAVFVPTAGARFGHLSVISLFVYAQATMAAGTLPALDPALEADVVHASVILWSFGTLVGVSVLYAFTILKSPRTAYDPLVDFAYPKRTTAFWILASIGISTLYYMSVGYLAFVESLQALINDTGEDVAALRLESYAGEKYFFPGYVNQFKNALLPALTIVVLTSAYHFRVSGRAVVGLILAPLTLLFLLGTGQRGAFVIALALAVVTAYFVVPRRVKKYIVRIGIVGILLFFLLTIASGRANRDLEAAPDFGSKLGVLFEQLAFRILGSNQMSSIVGFQYIHEQDIPAGSEWWQAFVGLLPGQPGSDLSNRIFAVLYGSTRGTSPLSLWGSTYHNWGLVGTVLIAALLATIFCRLAASINSTTYGNLVQFVGMAGVTITLGTWIADGPVSVLNKGLVMYALVWLWGSRIARRGQSAVLGGTDSAVGHPRRSMPRE